MAHIKLKALRTLCPVMGFGTGGSATWVTEGEGADMTLDTDTGCVTIRRADGGKVHDLSTRIVVTPAAVGWYAPSDTQPQKK